MRFNNFSLVSLHLNLAAPKSPKVSTTAAEKEDSERDEDVRGV